MNKKLKELARQAGFQITPWGNEELPCVHQEGPIDIELEKFAELIIRKCAKVADLADENKCEWIGGNILNHFGVEE
jgi:hypothetical protein